jgi:hypothetical protein
VYCPSPERQDADAEAAAGGSTPPRPPAAEPQQWFVLRPWLFDVTAGERCRARFWRTGRGSTHLSAVTASCRSSLHDVGDRSDDEPDPFRAFTVRLAGGGVTLEVVERVAPIRDLLCAVGPGGEAQIL